MKKDVGQFTDSGDSHDVAARASRNPNGTLQVSLVVQCDPTNAGLDAARAQGERALHEMIKQLAFEIWGGAIRTIRA